MHPTNCKSCSEKRLRLVLTILCFFCLNIINSQVYHTRSASSQKPDSVLGETWMETDSKWQSDGKTIYIYDSIQNTKSSLSSRWDVLSSSWVSTSKSDTYYDRNAKDSLEINSDWNNPAKKWVERNKTGYTYDNHGNNTLIASKYFDDELMDWVDSDKKEMTYDENGYDTLEIQSTWAVQTGWTASYKIRKVYDENGNNILSFLYSWDQTDFSKWLLYSRTERTFDLNGNMILSMPFSWDLFSSQWLPPQYKFESVFDGNGYLVSDSSCVWNPGSQSSGQWISTSKNEYTNNDEGSVTRMLTFISDGFSPWLAAYRATYFYPGRQVTLVPGISDHQIMFYPNPSREFVTFNLPDISVSTKIEIWDMEGRKLLEQVLPGDHTVNIRFLDEGMYICKIESEGRVYGCKIVKKGD